MNTSVNKYFKYRNKDLSFYITYKIPVYNIWEGPPSYTMWKIHKKNWMISNFIRTRLVSYIKLQYKILFREYLHLC